MEKKTYHFISHTHWDREWYLTFEQFRYRLVRLIDKLLDLLDRDPDFRCFHLDGQTIVLEDYHTMRPGNRQKLESYIRDGRILVGPWYQQNDLFLTSAESTVRNLMKGIADARELGGEMKVGYLPDHFGLIGQMPQILQQVGIDNAVFGRGYSLAHHRGPLFHWQSPDGSKVYGIHLYHWYNSAQRLPKHREGLKAMFDMLRAREQAVHRVPHYVMMNGVDHLEVQEDLPEVLDTLRELARPDEHIVQSSLPEYAEKMREYMAQQAPDDYETVCGELREGDEYSILAGTLSGRAYLKQANVHCHDLLEKWLEPLSLFCTNAQLDSYDQDILDYCWNLYMENHPHDSICGCSQDAVAAHMMDRFARINELAEDLISGKLKMLARQISAEGYSKEDQKLVVFNTSQLSSREVIRSEVSFLAEDEVEQFCIETSDGSNVPYRVITTEIVRKQVLSPVNLPGILLVRKFVIEWQPDVPPLGYAAYRVRPGRRSVIVQDRDEGQPVLENEFLRIEVRSNGRLNMLDKTTGSRYSDLGGFEDSGDGGDLYVHKTVAGIASSVWGGEVKFTDIIHNELYHECRYTFDWELPQGLDEATGGRSERLVACRFNVGLRLDRGSKHVKMTVEIDNQAKDHRIRLLLPYGERPGHIVAGGQFDAVKRSLDEGSEYERDANTHPFWKWVATMNGNEQGLALFAKGLHEYESTENGMMTAVTLHRGVKTIFMREQYELEEDIQTQSQCLGSLKLEMALRPFGETSVTQLFQEAEQFHQGIRLQHLPIDEARWNQGRPWVQEGGFAEVVQERDPNKHKPKLSPRGQFVTIEGKAMLSALKRSHQGSDTVIRLYSVEEQSEKVMIRSSLFGVEAWESDLLEVGRKELPCDGITMEANLPAKKIVTLLVKSDTVEHQDGEDHESCP